MSVGVGEAWAKPKRASKNRHPEPPWRLRPHRSAPQNDSSVLDLTSPQFAYSTNPCTTSVTVHAEQGSASPRLAFLPPSLIFSVSSEDVPHVPAPASAPTRTRMELGKDTHFWVLHNESILLPPWPLTTTTPLPPPPNFKEMATNLNLSECTATFRTKAHYEHRDRLQHVTGTLTHPTLGELATVSCLQIHGRMWFKRHGDFLEMMDDDSQELHEFSVTLFDKDSNVRPWLVDGGGARSGSGCWGMELSVGDMLYIKDLNVKEEFRRRGVGSYLLQKLLESPHMGYRGHAFCWPTPIGFRGDKAEWARLQAAITAFYRKNGFRRIGLTSFLAYSPDPSHPSRTLDAASDPETPSIEFGSNNPNAPDLSADETKAQYPLHCAISNTKDPSIIQLIRVAHNIDAASIRKHDVNGLTPVHIAASGENLHALRVLLELDPSGIAKDLKDAHNREGMTPLEALRSSMRSIREFSETLLSAWKGYTDEGLRCEYIMTKAMGLPLGVGEETEEEYVKKRKFGCTCGKCTGGWLSPRMRFRLTAQADIQHDMLRMEDYQFEARRPLSSAELLYSTLDYVPLVIRQEIYKTFYVGFYTIFHAISLVLGRRPQGPASIPTPQVVLIEALALEPRAVQFYLGKGGKVEYVLDATVDIAREQSALGDGTFEETFDTDEVGGGQGERYVELPKCANDLEFDIVRRNIGLAGGLVWGPYYERDEDEDGMEVDDDDDDSD
ncbi:unnamed protein product [Cyclocybe aegerita]|uniref:N-acetyltransferase domain-containing protein n=1 Tax=Cyclocybe aegerita TaxID=1973307 RepID=A0A8S0WZB5_CYCAE|nr:unnamed protein product [Cyclocybe aegerita]